MTVASVNSYSGPYAGNGVTVAFPFTFKAFSADDIAVDTDGVTISDSVYTVTLNADGNGGTVTFGTAPTADEIYIRSVPDFTQDIAFTNGGPFLPESHDEALDRAAVRDIYLNEQVERTPKVPLGEEGFELPSEDDRAGYLLAFDSDGDPDLSVTTAEITAMQSDIADNATAISAEAANRAAADAAMFAAAVLENAGLYANTAAGLAAVGEGEYFGVPGSGDVTVTLYRDVAGVATEINGFPSPAAMRRIAAPATFYGASPLASKAVNQAAIELAMQAVSAAGGGVVLLPPGGTYDCAVDTYAETGAYEGCVRLLPNVKLWIPAGATLRMAADEVGANAHVILGGGAGGGVIGDGVIDGGSLLSQSGYGGAYAQNGPGGIFLPPAAFCHRTVIGGGELSQLRVQNCFGNPVNGGGALGDEVTKIAVVGMWCDNVGEGPQIERADLVRMGHITSLNSTGNAAGDAAELSACTNFEVHDIYAEDSAGSGFDLFGCQKGTVRGVSSVNCNFNIHDFGPVDPCADVLCDDITVRYDSGGTGSSGIDIASVHATIAPTNIKVRNARVINEGAGDLDNGVNVNQNQDVATYGGGPYDIECDVTGTTNTGMTATRAPSLRYRGTLTDTGNYGISAETTGLLSTDVANWDIEAKISGAATADFRVNGTISPTGRLAGMFGTTQGPIHGLNTKGKIATATVSTAADSIDHQGGDIVTMTGALIARIKKSYRGHRLSIVFTGACEINNGYAASGDNHGVRTNTGANVNAVNGDVYDFVYNDVAGVWRMPE